jgi:DNA-directed RNA polymerase subunit RPC12/RpoP
MKVNSLEEFEVGVKCENCATQEEIMTKICNECSRDEYDEYDDYDDSEWTDADWECPYCGGGRAAIGIGCSTPGCQGNYDNGSGF